MAQDQYERTTYIPTVVLQNENSSEGKLYLDYLSADYNKDLLKIQVYTEYMVTMASESRLDIISNILYGTASLWWVIGMYNGIINPTYNLVIGQKLKIPDRNSVDTLLQSVNQPDITQGVIELQ